MDVALNLPGNAGLLPGAYPVVIIGANGSGKTRLARAITADPHIEFVNALRNTRVAPALPVMSFSDARRNYEQQANTARSQHWELQSDFDFLLAKLYSEDSTLAIRYRDASRNGLTPPEEFSTMDRVRTIWRRIFPGREIFFQESAPHIRVSGLGLDLEYPANTASDAEKAALYLLGKTLDAPPGVILIDEPETHFHSLLAVELWNELEEARPDLRFVYITHDLQFALSRHEATFILATPNNFEVLHEELPGDIAGALLGAASFSFHAKRVIFCEGEDSSRDAEFFRAWFNGVDTFTKPVGSNQLVLRCTQALRSSGIAMGLDARGLIDRDYLPPELLRALPEGVQALPTHEIEGIYCLPEVVECVLEYLGKEFDPEAYVRDIRSSIDAFAKNALIISRWKRKLEPNLESLLSGVSTRALSIDDVIAGIPTLFSPTAWSFSPTEELRAQRNSIDALLESGPVEGLLEILPSKPLISIAAKPTGLTVPDYLSLINRALRGGTPNLSALGEKLEIVLAPHLPPRVV